VACATKFSPRPPFYIVLTGLRNEITHSLSFKHFHLYCRQHIGRPVRFVDEIYSIIWNYLLILLRCRRKYVLPVSSDDCDWSDTLL